MAIKKKRTPALLILVVALWVGGISAGSLAMWNHEFSEGQVTDAPTEIPDTLRSLRLSEKPLTILMAVHPNCPCTDASLAQLDRLMVRNSDEIEVIGLIRGNLTSIGDSSIKDSSYWKRLEALPNARPVADPTGALATLLGANVSGATVAYDSSGLLRFQGGITASRGHAGASYGMDSLEDIARQLSPASLCSSPAFGCSLETPSNQK